MTVAIDTRTKEALASGGNNLKSTALSADPGKALQEMMDTIDALRLIYVEENEALANANTRLFLGLQEDKITRAQQYHDGLSQLMERKEEIKEAPLELREKLRKSHEEFSKVTHKNLWHLERMKKSVDRLNSRIMHSARKAAEKDGVNYGAQGKIQRTSRNISIGVSESA